MERGQLSEFFRKAAETLPVFAYRPRPEDQLPAANATEMTIVAEGGNQSGKTHWLLHQIAAYMMGVRYWLPRDHPLYVIRMGDGSPMPVPNSGRLVVSSYEVALKQTIEPKWNRIWPGDELVWWDSNVRGEGTEVKSAWGSNFFILSHKQGKMTGESATFDWVAYDEPPPRALRVALLRGLMQSAGPEIFACTMVFNPWMHRDIMSKNGNGRVKCFTFHTEANLDSAGGALKTAGFERFKDALTDEEKAVRIEGRSLGGGRCVGSFFDRAPWVCDNFQVPPNWYRLAAIDPHERKPDAVQWWAFSPSGLEAVIYDEVMDESTQGSREQTAGTMATRERKTGGRAQRAIIDPRFAQKTVTRAGAGKGKTVADEFRAAGRPVEPAPGLDKLTGFRRLNSWLATTHPITGLPRLRVMRRCVQTRESLSLLSWKMGATVFETLDETEGPDDFASLARYVVTYYPTVETAVARHEEQMIEGLRPNALNGILEESSDDTGDGSFVGV